MKFIPVISIATGLVLFLLIMLPVIQFSWWEFFDYQDNAKLIGSTSVLGVSVSPDQKRTAPYKQFNLAIPKMGLSNVTVLVNSTNLDTNLAQLPGTALPGEQGNVFISGHSSIPILSFLSGKKAWFNNLESLQTGDQVKVTALGQNFTYLILNKKIVSPDDVDVVSPPDDEGRYLTLMTCEPPGFNVKRLVVLAKLVQS